jgi:hypothetical protein
MRRQLQDYGNYLSHEVKTHQPALKEKRKTFMDSQLSSLTLIDALRPIAVDDGNVVSRAEWRYVKASLACFIAPKGLGFQPVSSVDYGWLALLSGPTISDVWMKNRSWLVVRYRLEAYATLRRCQVAAGTRKRLQEDFHTSRASPESKVA